MEVGEGAGEVEGDVGELTTALIRAEEDRTEGLDVGAELRAGCGALGGRSDGRFGRGTAHPSSGRGGGGGGQGESALGAWNRGGTARGGRRGASGSARRSQPELEEGEKGGKGTARFPRADKDGKRVGRGSPARRRVEELADGQTPVWASGVHSGSAGAEQ